MFDRRIIRTIEKKKAHRYKEEPLPREEKGIVKEGVVRRAAPLLCLRVQFSG